MSGSSADKPGRVKRELGEARRVRQAMTAEVEIYQYKLEKDFKPNRDFKYDVLEGCAGVANITAWAPEFGLTAIQPADLVYGWDLGTPAGRKQWKCAISEGKPLIAIFSVPCTMWCFYNAYVNFRGPEKQQILAALQDEERPLLRLAAWTCREQHRRNCLFLLESPPHSDMWRQQETTPVAELPGALWAISHACQFGAVGIKGKPIKKAMKVADEPPEPAGRPLRQVPRRPRARRLAQRSGEACCHLAQQFVCGDPQGHAGHLCCGKGVRRPARGPGA